MDVLAALFVASSQCCSYPILDPITTPAKPHLQPPLVTSFAALITT
jgi:hypothetical protein